MFGFSLAMLGSMHAVQWNHLRHHRHCLAEDDIEAMGARRSAWGALLLGPRFPIRLHRAALAGAHVAKRRWMAAELGGNLAVAVLVFGTLSPGVLGYQLLAMMAGQCMTAFFAVWTVHHGCSRAGPLARTVRNRFRAAVTFSMFFHLEHHLFPQVPTGPAAHPRPPPRRGGTRGAPLGVVTYPRMRTGGTSPGISRLHPVVALTSSTEMPGAISRSVIPSGLISNSP
jgi:fatty acid desaturase